MKKLFKNVLIACLCVGMLMMSGCTPKEPEKPQTTVDLSTYPQDIASWTMGDMKKYLEEGGVTNNADFMNLDLSQLEIEAIGCTAGFLYVDPTAGSVTDIVFYYDLSKPETKALYDDAVTNKAIIIGGDVENGMNLDAIISGFGFQLLGYDEEHINLCIKLLEELTAYYDVKDAWILK